jgi:Tol biopolymer transport system component
MMLTTSRFPRALPALLLAAAVVAVPLALVETNPAQATFPGTNGKIAFASQRTAGAGVDNADGDSEIFTMKPDGRGIAQLTSNGASEDEPVWSPDGSKIAFTSDRDENHREIYVMNAAPESATNQPVRLTNNAVSDSDPNWSPDGKKLAFTSDRASFGTSDIFIMDAKDEINNVGDPVPDGNGDNLIRLTTDPKFDSSPAWSPDGSKIAFESTRHDIFGEIYVMDAAPEGPSNQPARLTDNTVADSGPDWSPNGSKIAFASERDGNRNIYVMNAPDGSEPKRLTKKAAGDFDPAWSPDGTRIAFRSDRGGGDPDVFVMKARPESKKNRPKNLTNNGVFESEPDWQPIPPSAAASHVKQTRKTSRSRSSSHG